DPAWGASQCKRVGARHWGVSRCAQHRSPPLCLDQVRGSDPGEYRALRTRHHGHPSRTTYVTNHCYRTLAENRLWNSRASDSHLSLDGAWALCRRTAFSVKLLASGGTGG